MNEKKDYTAFLTTGQIFEKELNKYFIKLKLDKQKVSFENFKTYCIMTLVELLNFSLHKLDELGVITEATTEVENILFLGKMKTKLYNDIFHVFVNLANNSNLTLKEPCKNCGCTSYECEFCEGLNLYRHIDDREKKKENLKIIREKLFKIWEAKHK